MLADGRRRTVVVTSSMSGATASSSCCATKPRSRPRAACATPCSPTSPTSSRRRSAAQLASLELLVDRLAELDPDETRKLIVSLQRGALRLTQLIDNLLESVRIEAGRATLRRQSVHLDEVVEEAVEMIRPLADQRGQIDRDRAAASASRRVGDGPRLVQVFVNLLANAGKFAPDGTTIRVGRRRRTRAP